MNYINNIKYLNPFRGFGFVDTPLDLSMESVKYWITSGSLVIELKAKAYVRWLCRQKKSDWRLSGHERIGAVPWDSVLPDLPSAGPFLQGVSLQRCRWVRWQKWACDRTYSHTSDPCRILSISNLGLPWAIKGCCVNYPRVEKRTRMTKIIKRIKKTNRKYSVS